MPRKPTDRVVEHRITLGKIERDALQSFVTANSFSKVATPVVSGMSDVSFMVLATALLAIYFPNIILPKGASTMEEIVTAIQNGLPDKIEGEWGKIGVQPIDLRDPSTWRGIIPGAWGDPSEWETTLDQDGRRVRRRSTGQRRSSGG